MSVLVVHGKRYSAVFMPKDDAVQASRNLTTIALILRSRLPIGKFRNNLQYKSTERHSKCAHRMIENLHAVNVPY
jgi:hypothetical protein